MPTFDIFLKFDGIKGDSTDDRHANETVVLSYEQGIDHPAPSSPTGGGSAGRPTFSGIRFRKPVDVGSIPLLLACASGKHIRDARFAFRRLAARVDFYTVTLEDVLVTHMIQRAGTGAQYPLSFDELLEGSASEGFLDELTLNYMKIRWEYRPIGPTGAPGAAIKGGWDLKANSKI
jgi:type VI secretion system secreted protein Hcp